MLFIATRNILATILLVTATIAASAADFSHPPKHILDPVLGLRVSLANADIDPLPEKVRAVCVQMADNDTWTGRQWIFGMVETKGATYYLVSGYFERLHPLHGQPRFHQPDQGGMYVVKGKDCGGDPAQDVFDVRDFEQVPQAVLELLADDLKSRLVRAFGGEARLRAKIKQQGIKPERLTPELAKPLMTYFGAP